MSALQPQNRSACLAAEIPKLLGSGASCCSHSVLQIRTLNHNYITAFTRNSTPLRSKTSQDARASEAQPRKVRNLPGICFGLVYVRVRVVGNSLFLSFLDHHYRVKYPFSSFRRLCCRDTVTRLCTPFGSLNACREPALPCRNQNSF